MYNRTGKQKWTPKGVDKTHPSVDQKIWLENKLKWIKYLPGWWWFQDNVKESDGIWWNFQPFKVSEPIILLLEVSYWIWFYHFTATWIWVVQKIRQPIRFHLFLGFTLCAKNTSTTLWFCVFKRVSQFRENISLTWTA